MDDETRTALADISATMTAGFTRMDRYFELQQAQFVEFRSEVYARFEGLDRRVDVLTERVDVLTERVDVLTGRVDGIEAQLHSLRDWATAEVAGIRAELREIRRGQVEAAAAQAGMRSDLDRLTRRVDRLEERVNGLTG